MAGFRRRRKSGGFTRTSTNKGWTTSSSYGNGKAGGSGYRVTTTHKADGRTIVRRTTRGGDGWFKVEQQTLNKKPRPSYKSSSADGGSVAIVLLMMLLWGVVELFSWIHDKLKPIIDFFERHDVVDIVTVICICIIGTWLFVKLLLRMSK